MLRARDLVETELHAGLMQRVANQISARGGHVGVVLAEDHGDFAFEVGCALQRVVVLAAAEGVAVDIGCEVGDCGGDARVKRAAVGEVAAEAHARGAEAAGAGGEGEEGVDRQSGVFVVGGDGFLDLVRVARIRAGDVVGERVVRGEFVVGRGRGDDVALRSDLAGEAGDRAGDCVRDVLLVYVFLFLSLCYSLLLGLSCSHYRVQTYRCTALSACLTLVNLREEHDTRKLGSRVSWDNWMCDKDP